MTTHHQTPHHVGSFHDLKEILATHVDFDTIPYEIKERTYFLCSNFLGHAWKSVPIEDMCLTRMKGGMSNMLFLCKLPAGHEPTGNEPDKTLLRVYFNPETESHLVAESVIFTLLSERQLGPQLFGIFNGGRLEEFIVSRPLACPEIREPEMSRKIARKLAHVHKLNVPISKEPTYLCEALERWMKHLLDICGCVHPYTIKMPDGRDIVITEPILRWEIETIRWILQLYRRHVKLTLPVPVDEHSEKVRIIGLDELSKELKMIKRAILHSTSPIVFCHNDLQEGNILLPLDPNACSKDLVIIDFEYASYNYRAFDFANHLCEWAIDYSLETPPHFKITLSDYPNVDEQKNFIRAYLDESTGVVGSYTDDDLQRIVEEVEPFVAVSHFFWGVWALLQVELSPVKFGFADYGKDRLSLYFKLKPNLIKLLHKTPEFTTSNLINSSESKVNDITNCIDSTPTNPSSVNNKEKSPAKLEAFVAS